MSRAIEPTGCTQRWCLCVYSHLMLSDRRLLLVRHCQAGVDALQEPSTWRLTPGGIADADRLARSSIFSATAVVAAGDEPKMVDSVRPLAGHRDARLAVSAALRESASGGWVAASEFERFVRRFLEAPGQAPAPGWESAEAAVDRFLAEVEALAVAESAGDIVVCTGGRILTATLVRIGLLRTEEAFEAWTTLQTPDVVPVVFDGQGEASLPGSAAIEALEARPSRDDGASDRQTHTGSLPPR
jgi:broad specificity phosphatase PhoE